MKKWIIVLALLIPTLAKADTSVFEVISAIPSLKQGVAFSLVDNNINYLSTVDLINWKGFSLEGGYAGTAKNTGDKLVSVLSYEAFSLKDKNVWPILRIVEFRPGIWVGMGRIGGNNEIDYGVSATVVSLSF